MSEALAVVHPQTQRGLLTKEVLQVQAEQRALLAEYVQKQMVEGTDYGVIPGTKDKTLLKPGAEKLVELFRCTPKYALVERIEDFDKPLLTYMFRVRLFQRDSQVVLAEGYGSANSREGRYRWRNANLKCPQCAKETIIKGKDEYGGGWVCFAKKGGCGAKFKDADKSITEQERGRIENDDIATQANSLLKVAKKRALVDGAIALARVSDLFTQDMEDLADIADQARVEAERKPAAAPAQSPTPSGGQAKAEPPPTAAPPAAASGKEEKPREKTPVEKVIDAMFLAAEHKSRKELDEAVKDVAGFDDVDKAEIRQVYIKFLPAVQ